MAALIRSLSAGSEIAAAALAFLGALLAALADDFRTRFPEVVVVVLGVVGLLLPELTDASLAALEGRPTLPFVDFRVLPLLVVLGGDSSGSFTGLGTFVEA
jgi:hypothetical protein